MRMPSADTLLDDDRGAAGGSFTTATWGLPLPPPAPFSLDCGLPLLLPLVLDLSTGRPGESAMSLVGILLI